MPLTFLNGGLNLTFTGFQFTTAVQLLTQIKNTLTTAGWTTAFDQITANSLLVMRATDNSHSCWVRFACEAVSGQNYHMLKIRGDLDGTGAILSPDELTVFFRETVINRLWLTSDESGGCIAIKGNNELPIKGFHFGFPFRPSPALDPFGWAVGELGVIPYRNFWAKSFRYNVNWRRCTDDYEPSSFNGSIANLTNTPLIGTGDRLTTILTSGFTGTPAGNKPSLYAYNGAVNAINGLPLLSEYFLPPTGKDFDKYDIGVDAFSASTETPAQFGQRGAIRYAVTGVASLRAEEQGIDQTNNAIRYLSCGGKGVQGMRIA